MVSGDFLWVEPVQESPLISAQIRPNKVSGVCLRAQALKGSPLPFVENQIHQRRMVDLCSSVPMLTIIDWVICCSNRVVRTCGVSCAAQQNLANPTQVVVSEKPNAQQQFLHLSKFAPSKVQIAYRFAPPLCKWHLACRLVVQIWPGAECCPGTPSKCGLQNPLRNQRLNPLKKNPRRAQKSPRGDFLTRGSFLARLMPWEPSDDSRESGDSRESANRFSRIGPSKICGFLRQSAFSGECLTPLVLTPW